MPVRVLFENVGRGRMTWEDTLPELTDYQLSRSVQRHRALASKHYDFVIVTMNEAGTAGTDGVIVAGLHTVGAWRVVT